MKNQNQMKMKLFLPLLLLFILMNINPTSGLSVIRSPSGDPLAISKATSTYNIKYTFSEEVLASDAIDMDWKVYIYYASNEVADSGCTGSALPQFVGSANDIKTGSEVWHGEDFTIDIIKIYDSVITKLENSRAWGDANIAYNPGKDNSYVCTQFKAYFDTISGYMEDYVGVKVYEKEQAAAVSSFSSNSALYLGIIVVVIIVIIVIRNRDPPKKRRR